MHLDYNSLINNKVTKTFIYLFWMAVVAFQAAAATKYPGQAHLYLTFGITSNLLLYFGFRERAIFFDTFIGIFFWLGFWLKFTVHILFSNGIFNDHIGRFDSSPNAFDHALLISSFAFLGLLIGSLIRERFFSYPEKVEFINTGLSDFYYKHRKAIWAVFLLLIVFIGFSNAYYGIYQRGSITKTVLPFGLNGIYKWLLLFGLASVSATVLWIEFQIKKQTSILVITLSLIEACISNVSLLSRGMILNGSALLFGVLRSLQLNSIKTNIKHILLSVVLFVGLFTGSAYLVNYTRAEVFSDVNDTSVQMGLMSANTKPLFIDRWVGIEGVMAISSYPSLGWHLWHEALNETYDEHETSFYDNNIISSYYNQTTDKSKHHFVSLPGIVAFLFYPGSFVFLFFAMLTCSLGAAMIEYLAYELSGRNIILCSLFAQIIAFRFSSFGYVPKQSHLLFGSLMLNLAIIWAANKYMPRKNNKQ